jgi:peptidoglycan/LPS O-acetylase OafA/YrhL
VKKPDYFPVLDSMRFVASMCVFAAHSVSFFNVPAAGAYFGDYLRNAGYYGVLFFYTLSGFLITYLLLKEKKRTGTIAVKRFYKRRALRICPLYYLIILPSFFVIPYLFPGHFDQGATDWWLVLLLFLLFLPNIAMLRGFYMPTCFHMYTIGFEEQFYLVWPLIVRRAGDRPLLLLGICFFAPSVLELLHVLFISHGLLPNNKPAAIIQAVLMFINYFNIPAFGAGAAGAYWYFWAGEKQLEVVGKKIWRWLLLVLITTLMCLGKPWTVGYVNLLSVLFVFLILNMVISGMEHPTNRSILSQGGKISYGIYIYHPAVFLLVFNYVINGRFNVGHPLRGYFIYLILSLALVLVIATLSYKYFELPFLRKKDRFRQPPDPAISLASGDSKQ